MPGHTPYSVSPSSYDTFECPRKWAYDKIDRIPRTQSPKAALGTRCHSIAEAYLKEATLPNALERMTITTGSGKPQTFYPGQIVSNILHHLPRAGSVSATEVKWSFTYKGFTFGGYKDWETSDTVGDHKFTTSLQYALTSQGLRADPQRILYTAHSFVADHLLKEITAQWTYGEFAAKQSTRVRLKVLRNEYEREVDSLLPRSEQMVRGRETWTEAGQAPTNTSVCSKYGGCAYLLRCQPSASKRVVSMASAALEKIKARQAARAGNAVTDTLGTPLPTTVTPGVPDLKPETAAAAGQINSPVAERVAPPAETVVIPEAETVGVPAEHVVIAEKPKRGPGRPKKDATAATPAPAPTSDKQPWPLETPAADPAPVTANARNLRILYVNCRPNKINGVVVRDAVDIIAEANSAICDELDVDHYALIEYGKGRGALAVAIGQYVEQQTMPFDVTIDVVSPEAHDALQAFAQRAGMIVRSTV